MPCSSTSVQTEVTAMISSMSSFVNASYNFCSSAVVFVRAVKESSYHMGTGLEKALNIVVDYCPYNSQKSFNSLFFRYCTWCIYYYMEYATYRDDTLTEEKLILT